MALENTTQPIGSFGEIEIHQGETNDWDQQAERSKEIIRGSFTSFKLPVLTVCIITLSGLIFCISAMPSGEIGWLLLRVYSSFQIAILICGLVAIYTNSAKGITLFCGAYVIGALISIIVSGGLLINTIQTFDSLEGLCVRSGFCRRSNGLIMLFIELPLIIMCDVHLV